MINPVSFGKHFVTADVGASTKNGSLKLSIRGEDGNEIAKKKTTVFEPDEKRNEFKFANNLAQRIVDFENENKEAVLKADPENEMQLTACYPGPIVKNGVALSNFYYDDNRSKSFDTPINTNNIDNYIASKGINIIQSRHVNDMAATGAAVLNNLRENHNKVVEPGREILYLYPGGGLGSGVIMVGEDNTVIKPTEKQHALGPNGRILEENACAPGLIKNFTEALGVKKGIFGEDALVVDNFDKAKEYLPNLTQDQFNRASKMAINKLMNSLAVISARQICDAKTNTIVITGPIMNGLRKAVNNNPEFAALDNGTGDDKFVAIMKEKTRSNLAVVGNRLMGEDKDFNILVLKLLDNTEAAHILQSGKVHGNPPAWYDVK